MARLFNGSTQYLSNTASPVTGPPCSIAGWFYAATTTVNYDLIFVRASASDVNYLGIYISEPANLGKISAAAADGATDALAVTTTSFTANTWNHAAATFTSATSRAAYLNGGGKGTDATSRSPTINSLTVGGFSSGSLFGAMNGRLAEIGLWDAALTDAEVTSLANGTSPLRVRPQNLRCYWPLYGTGSPEPNYARNSTDYSLTLQAAPTQISHAPVQMPFGFSKYLSIMRAPSNAVTADFAIAAEALSGHLTGVSSRTIWWRPN